MVQQGLEISDSEFLRYQRQIALNEIGVQGQVRLSKAHVLIIGCGGLGSAAAQYLTAAGVGHLVIVDDDVVESSNLQRQTIYRESDLGMSKALSMQEQLLAINNGVNIRAITSRLADPQLNLEVMLADVVLDCSDNMPTRQQLNRACFYQSTDLISGSAIGWQGQFAVFEYSQREQSSNQACYRCLFPFDEIPGETKCSERGVVGPVVGTLGNYQAIAALQKLAVGEYQLTTQAFYTFDGLNLQWQTLAISPEPQCTVCAPQSSNRTTQYTQTGGAYELNPNQNQ